MCVSWQPCMYMSFARVDDVTTFQLSSLAAVDMGKVITIY